MHVTPRQPAGKAEPSKEPAKVRVVWHGNYPPLEEMIPRHDDRERFKAIANRIIAIRKRFELHDLDTARLWKPFFDEPGGIGTRAQLNSLGYLNRHRNRMVGDEFTRDWQDEEFRCASPTSPLNLDAMRKYAASDEEALLAGLLAHRPSWDAQEGTEDRVRETISEGLTPNTGGAGEVQP